MKPDWSHLATSAVVRPNYPPREDLLPHHANCQCSDCRPPPPQANAVTGLKTPTLPVDSEAEAQFEKLLATKRHKEAASVALETPNTSNRREHWSVTARRTKRQREALKRKIRAWLNSHTPPKLLITVVRVSPRFVDQPNLGSALKAVIDGIADGLRVDDGSPLIEWKLTQRKGPAAVEFTIERAP